AFGPPLPPLLEPALWGAVSLSLFASPHLLGHDLTLIAPVLVGGLAWLAGRPTETRWPGPATLAVIAGWALLSFASLADLAQNSVGLPGRATPWALLIVGATWCALTAGAGGFRRVRLGAQQRGAAIETRARTPADLIP